MKKAICGVISTLIFMNLFFTACADTNSNFNILERIDNAVCLKVDSPIAYVNMNDTFIDPDNTEVVPLVQDGRTLIPIRFISESFGAKVGWDSNTMEATIEYNGVNSVIVPYSNVMTVNGTQDNLDVPAQSINGRLYIPLRKIAENILGKKVFYDSGLIIISDKENIIDPMSEKKVISDLLTCFKDNFGRLNYMIYYSTLDSAKIETAKKYDLVILHPLMGDITREQVKEIQKGQNPNDPSDDVIVLGYISIGEDLRTASLTDTQIYSDPRFKGDRTGPRVDPRGPVPNGGKPFTDIDPLGNPSPGGFGFASYYLDDNNFDGKPDRNAVFNGLFVNAGDPKWYDVVNNMSIDAPDHLAGLKEILTDHYGRGLGCDGVFLDTIDTCAPNSYTDSSSFNQSEFEWTSPGMYSFIQKIREEYSDKLILQNRGLFFFDPRLPHYQFNAGNLIDFVMFESYRLDSNSNVAINENFYKDNMNAFMPKLMAEANRPNGFRVLSLGYAEGPANLMLKETLLGKSTVSKEMLMEDIRQTEDIAGFNHYITDGGVELVNTYVMDNASKNDLNPPVWSSTYNASPSWPPDAPTPRIGVQKVSLQGNDAVLSWDVALDKSKVRYTAYYQTTPFDFKADPNLSSSEKIDITPVIGDGYKNGVGPDVYPYQATIKNLMPGNTYYFVIRATDISPNKNQEKNKAVLSVNIPE